MTDKTAEEVLKESIPKNCIWIYSTSGQGDWTLVNTPSRYVTQAMESYASQKTSSLESEVKRLEKQLSDTKILLDAAKRGIEQRDELLKAADEVISFAASPNNKIEYYKALEKYQSLKD